MAWRWALGVGRWAIKHNPAVAPDIGPATPKRFHSAAADGCAGPQRTVMQGNTGFTRLAGESDDADKPATVRCADSAAKHAAVADGHGPTPKVGHALGQTIQFGAQKLLEQSILSGGLPTIHKRLQTAPRSTHIQLAMGAGCAAKPDNSPSTAKGLKRVAKAPATTCTSRPTTRIRSVDKGCGMKNG